MSFVMGSAWHLSLDSVHDLNHLNDGNLSKNLNGDPNRYEIPDAEDQCYYEAYAD